MDDELVDLFSNLIEEYVYQQFILGRLFIMEDEIYKMLGYPFPSDKPNRRFQLRGGRIDSWEFATRLQENSTNIVQFSDYKK